MFRFATAYIMKLKVFFFILLTTLVLAQVHNESSEVGEEPTTECSIEVQCEKSLFSKEDLLSVIDDVLNTLSFTKIINSTIQTNAVSIRDKYIKKIQTSIEWFAKRPEHLKHILEDVTLNRQFVEENVAKMRQSLMMHSDLITLFEDKSNKVNKIFKKLVHNKKLCELNCEHYEVDFRQAVRDVPSDRYCASLIDVQKMVKEQLEKIGNEYSEEILNQIKAADEKYDLQIKTKFKDMKEIALKEFGRPMYDILDLHDRYQHLLTDLKEFKIEHVLMKLTDLNIEMENLLVKLNNAVNIYSRYCKTCDAETIQYYRLFEDRQHVQRDDVRYDFLDSLIKSKLSEIYNSTQSDLQNIFQELDEKLSKVNMVNALLSNLKPLQKEINDLTKKEIDEFNALDVSRLKTDIDLIIKLIANTIDLLGAIVREYIAIQKLINDFNSNDPNVFIFSNM